MEFNEREIQSNFSRMELNEREIQSDVSSVESNERERALWSKQFGTGGGGGEASAGVQVAQRLIPLLYVYTIHIHYNTLHQLRFARLN